MNNEQAGRNGQRFVEKQPLRQHLRQRQPNNPTGQRGAVGQQQARQQINWSNKIEDIENQLYKLKKRTKVLGIVLGISIGLNIAVVGIAGFVGINTLNQIKPYIEKLESFDINSLIERFTGGTETETLKNVSEAVTDTGIALDNELVTVVFKGITESELMAGPELKLSVSNKTDTKLSFSVEDAVINDVEVNSYGNQIVNPNETVEFNVNLTGEAYTDLGLDGVSDIETLRCRFRTSDFSDLENREYDYTSDSLVLLDRKDA